jgi:hypothetical protein
MIATFSSAVIVALLLVSLTARESENAWRVRRRALSLDWLGDALVGPDAAPAMVSD